MRARPSYAQVLEREVRFYRELAHESRLRTPHAYLADFNRDTLDTALVLEDLGQGIIYETGTCAVPLFHPDPV